MKLNLQWNDILPILKKGVILEKKQLNPNQKTLFASPNSRIIFDSARSTGQMHGYFGQEASSGYISQIKTGELFPDQVMGWSTKSILVGLLVLMILKVQRCG